MQVNVGDSDPNTAYTEKPANLMSFLGIKQIASNASSSAKYVFILSVESVCLNLLKTFGASTPPFKPKITVSVIKEFASWRLKIIGRSDIFWLRSMRRPLIKNDIAYLVSPKISATYSAKLMIFSFIGNVNFTSPNLSEAITNLILIGTVKQQSCSSIDSLPNGIDTFFNYKI